MALWIGYTIYFTDPNEYAFALSISGDVLFGGVFFNHSPATAISLFNLPATPKSGPITVQGERGWFVPTYNQTLVANIPNPLPSGIPLPTNVDSVIVPGQAGNPPGVYPPSSDLEARWGGNIMFANLGNGAVANIPQRRWIGSPEWEATAEGGTGISASNLCRDASRTVDGHGFAIRGANNTGVWNRLLNQYRTGLTTRESWERFYIRIRAVGAVAVGIWRCHGSVSVSAGAGLKVNIDRTISAFAINAVSTETLIATTPALDLNTWYLVDLIQRYGDGGSFPPQFRLYINHALIINGSPDSQVQFHQSSDLGKWTGLADTQVEIDLDDWINSDIPVDPDTGLESLTSVDWALGSHVKKYYSASATTVNWIGNGSHGALNQGVSPQSNQVNTLTSTTSGALIEGLTEVPALDAEVIDTTGFNIGPVAAEIGSFNRNNLGTDGSLGYKVAGGAPVDTTINQTGTDAFYSVAYQPSGLAMPADISPFSIRHVKSADANTDTTTSLVAVAEQIGIWGPEDDPNTQEVGERLTFLHNCRYTNSEWGYVGAMPLAPVFAVGGTYVGNNGVQDINLPAPCHFLWIRPTTGAPTGGIKFFGASLDAHFGAKDRVVPNVRVWIDDTGQAKFTVTGASLESNLLATTYQYIAFCDPGMRFNLCGAYAHGTTGPSPQTNLLIDPDFTPEAGFVQSDLIGSAGSNATGLFFKGPGNGASDGNGLTGSNVAAFGSFGLGMLISQSGIHLGGGQMNYSLWRTVEPNCAATIIQVNSYVGNGTNPRTINLTPVSGRFPLFVLVIPVAAAASFYRDPSHTGANSSNADTLANSTLAITAVGMDSITVNSALNANLVTYNVFVICGDTAGMNNGTFYKPTCEPDLGPYYTTPPPLPDIAVMGEGGLILNGITALTLLKDVSGIYTLVPGKTNDTLYDRQTGQPNVDVKIPNPIFKTGFIGG